MQVVQMLVTITYGDAVGNDVLAIDKALNDAGFNTGIYAENIGNRLPLDRVHHISELPKLKDNDVIIYHYAIGAELNYKLPTYSGRKIMVYHNVTPDSFFSDYSLHAQRLSKEGIKGVKYLADKIDYCLADSTFNKLDLEKMGYICPIDVLPILIPFEDYKKEPNKEVIEKYSDDGYINLLFTGRIAPNKCQEDVIAAFYQFHKNYCEQSRLILVGNYEGMENYYKRLSDYAEQLGIGENVVFTGHIGFDEILSYYIIADAFVCMSEHEGFCVPLVEAMVFNIPIIAYDSTAIAETLGGSGFLIKEKNPLETAGIISFILNNKKIKETMIQNQKERLKDFSLECVEKQLITYMNAFIEEAQQ